MLVSSSVTCVFPTLGLRVRVRRAAITVTSRPPARAGAGQLPKVRRLRAFPGKNDPVRKVATPSRKG
jgi:hypothetical protein